MGWSDWLRALSPHARHRERASAALRARTHAIPRETADMVSIYLSTYEEVQLIYTSCEVTGRSI